MAKKERTAKQLANDERLRQMAKDRAKKKVTLKEQPPVAGEAPAAEHPVPQAEPTISVSEYQNLVAQIQELKAAGFDKLLQGQQSSGAQLTNKGIIGIQEKYALDPANYPSPAERLAEDPKLAKFAFNINYELEYNVTSSQYETKDGRNMVEPKFELKLNRVVFDEDGEPTNGRYVVARLIMHEDPQSAITVAREQGIEVPSEVEQSFLNEMRYLQMRDWVRGCFYPPKPEVKKNRRDMVIDGKVVEYFEVSSEKSESMPFKELIDSNKKL